MKFVTLVAVIVGLAGLPALAQAECVYPDQDVEMPDGTSATKDDMIATQQAVKAYMADMEAYLACLREEHAATSAEAAEDEDPEVKARREAMFTKRHDAAVDQMHLVGARFNEEVRAYKAQAD